MGRKQGQDLTRSTRFLLFVVVLLTTSHVSMATPPLAQVAGEGDEPISVKEDLARNATEGPGPNGAAPADSSNVTSPAEAPATGPVPVTTSTTAPAPAPVSKSTPAPASAPVSKSTPAPEPLPVTSSTPSSAHGQPSNVDSDTDDVASNESCGVNAHLENDVCVCDDEYTTNVTAEGDPGSPDDGCPCVDRCWGPQRCPSKTNCVNVGCGAGYRCKCDNGYYDVVSSTCKGACDFYGDAVCGDETRACKSTTLDTFTCECAKGYKDEGDGVCQDVDECEDSSSCHKRNEVCTNTPGSFKCSCKEGYVRDDNGNCRAWKQCKNPQWHTCDQLCQDGPAGKPPICECYKGFSLENGACVIDDKNRECECEGLVEGTWFCWTNDESVDECYPKAGFEISADNETVDVEECTKFPDLCGPNSACTEEWGSASCACLGGYVSPEENGAFCVALKCPQGQVPVGDQCVDPCSSSPCGGGGGVPYTCTVGEDGAPECRCGSECLNQLQPSSDLSVYSGTLTILRLPGALEVTGFSTGALIASLETIFGRGAIDVTLTGQPVRRRRQAGTAAFPPTRDREDKPPTLEARFDLMTEETYENTEDIAEVLQSRCQDAGGVKDHCALPGGVIVDRSAIAMLDNTDPCKKDSCPFPYTECKKMDKLHGRYTCECVAGFEAIEGGMPGMCKDVDECKLPTTVCAGECINTPGNFTCVEPCKPSEDEELKRELEESEGTLTVVSAVLGTLFCLALVAIGVLTVLKNNKPRRRIENVAMTTTTPVNGFDNGGFHQ